MFFYRIVHRNLLERGVSQARSEEVARLNMWREQTRLFCQGLVPPQAGVPPPPRAASTPPPRRASVPSQVPPPTRRRVASAALGAPSQVPEMVAPRDETPPPPQAPDYTPPRRVLPLEPSSDEDDDTYIPYHRLRRRQRITSSEEEEEEEAIHHQEEEEEEEEQMQAPGTSDTETLPVARVKLEPLEPPASGKGPAVWSVSRRRWLNEEAAPAEEAEDFGFVLPDDQSWLVKEEETGMVVDEIRPVELDPLPGRLTTSSTTADEEDTQIHFYFSSGRHGDGRIPAEGFFTSEWPHEAGTPDADAIRRLLRE